MINCGPTILDFNSPVRGGVDTLVIRGYNFGPVQGAGEVFFRNADISQFPYTAPNTDVQDYIYWSDTLVKVQVPSFNQNLFNGNGLNNSAGTGNFILYAPSTQTVAGILNSSNHPFIVTYSLFNVLNPNNNKKTKIHLLASP